MAKIKFIKPKKIGTKKLKSTTISKLKTSKLSSPRKLSVKTSIKSILNRFGKKI
jgi:hypothetical protein